jgi:hypothetical protein
MTTYIINAPILTTYGFWDFEGPLTDMEAKSIIQDGFVSGIGHSASAEFLSHYLNTSIPTNRINITMKPGDSALILRLLDRLPEGKLLNESELNKTPFELGLLTRLR